MKRNLSLKRFILFGLLIMSQYMFCQLNDFNFSVTTTDETCAGNGSIAMVVSGTAPDATISYTLFLYPDTATPIAQTSASMFNNLNSGNYLVIATQTLGNVTNTQSADATITDLTTSLNFEIAQVFMGDCNTASLVANVLSGNAISYEILSGPVTAPPQSSNTFNGLPEGTYVIRVYDTCNNALSKTFTLLLDPNTFTLGSATLPTVFDNCDELTITNTLTAQTDGMLIYPFTLTYTIFPPDGSVPITFSQIYNSGSEVELAATETIDSYGDEIFDIEIVAEDPCGNIVSITNTIDPNPTIIMTPVAGFCGKNLNIQVAHFVPPYTMEFTQAPPDFDPTDFNEGFPGPYAAPITTFGQEELAVPYGTYSVMITDACGRTGTKTYEVEEEPIEPVVTPSNTGCDPEFGDVTISIPDREIVSAIFLEVPTTYGETPPIDISTAITTNGLLLIEDVPVGSYLVEVTDNCGNIYLVEFGIPEASGASLDVNTTPNCATTTGTLRIASTSGNLASVVITAAPITFPESLPYDYSSEILSAGIFYVNDLPEGTYTIEVTDICSNEFEITQTVSAYVSNPAIYNLQRNCGSFNLGIVDTDETVWDQTYWFQKYFPESDAWGHPYTGVLFSEETMPNSSNAIEIANEETIFNIFLIGTFRLLKAFQPYNNPTPGQRCYDVFAEFEVSSDLVINGVYNLDCEGAAEASDIFVDVTGVEPYHFSIVSPIALDNGNSPIFNSLETGTYEIRVEDVCGSIETIIVNLEDLLPVVNIFQPTDLVMCSEDGNNQAVFDFSQQNGALLGNQNPDNFTITYHFNQNDADTGDNPLPASYENTVSPQTIYARVIHNTLNICYATVTFQLIVGAAPQLGADETIIICDGSAANLSTNTGYDAYLWSTGETAPSITITNSGTYTVTVSENYGDFFCDAVQTFTVDQSGEATIESISVMDWSTNNSIAVVTSGLGDYEYSLDGINYQPENDFTNLQPGEYTVYVRDINGCGVVTEDVYLLNYMKFFTPNGDDYHEVWQVLGAQFEPELEVVIFDRYGKLLAAFNGHDRGWDGRYNGQNMPSNDYWFVVRRANGRAYQGHFALKR